MIRVESLVYGYEDERALDGVTAEFKEGGFVLLLGGNGSGKTTFLRHLNGLLLPDEGNVYVDGVPTDEDEEHARRRVGMTFQDAASQVVAETVEDDIAFGPENLGLERDEIQRRVDEAAEAVGATELLDRSPYELSGGELRRVTLAGVLAMRPDVLALDEPLAGLDYDGERSVVERIVEENEKGTTVVVATHDAAPFVEYATRAVVLDDGKIVEDGTPDELFSGGVEEYGVRTPWAYR